MGRVLEVNNDRGDWDREFTFTERDFHVLRRLVNEHTGISLSDAKRELVYSRLSRRLRYLQLKSFRKYCEYLQSEAGNEELVHFINAITTNLTSFFREPHHFEIFASRILKEFVQKKVANKRFRVWSAGCSTGEEPYTISMTINSCQQMLPDDADIKILATDLDSNVLEIAKRGVYLREKIKTIPPQREKRWFISNKRDQSGYIHVRPEIQQLVSFKQLNLMSDWPMKGPFNVIFCRNVVIYFNKATQKELVDRFANILEPDGYLFLGHSESLFKVSDRFKLVGQTAYQKIK